MNNIQKRFLRFLLGCIPTRYSLSYLSYKIDKKYLPYLGLLTLTFALGFLRIYFFGSEVADRQLSWANVEKIWWNHLRIVHGLLYLAFSISAFLKKDYSWKIIMVEATIGLFSFLHHHYINSNFKKLFI